MHVAYVGKGCAGKTTLCDIVDRRLAVELFFFQAEDGIRDGHVTEFRRVLFRSTTLAMKARVMEPFQPVCRSGQRVSKRASRSEERRVGKECRSRWSA